MRCIVGHILGSVSSPSPSSQPRPRSHDSWSQKYVSRPSLFVSHAHSLITTRHHSHPPSHPPSHIRTSPGPYRMRLPDLLRNRKHSRHPSLIHPGRRFPAGHPVVCALGKLAAPPCRYVSAHFVTNPHILFYTHLAWTHGRMANLNPHEPALTFILAPFPNWICSRCASADDLSPEFNSAYIDFGRFLTGMLVVRTSLGSPLDPSLETIRQ